MYDVVVIGARCAGAPTAMLLARKGYKVLLLDKSSFPSDIRSGHFIHRDGPQRLRRWRLLERIAATNCPPVTSIVSDVGDFPLTADDLVVDGVAAGYGPRRSALDRVLVEAAVEAGAEFRPGVSLEALLIENDRVTGVRTRSIASGAKTDLRARITVGADGRHSRMADLVHAPMYETHPVVACWYFAYWSGVAGSALEIYSRSDKALFVHPTNDRLTAIFVGRPIASLGWAHANVEAAYLDAIRSIPGLYERVCCGRREERIAGAVNLANFYRRPYGQGWALVGDAGYHKDPYLALGICDAFRDVDYLVEAVDSGLSGQSDLQQALAVYERRRNEMSHQMYQRNLQAARFVPPTDDELRTRARIRGNPEAIRAYFLAREGLVPAAAAAVAS